MRFDHKVFFDSVRASLFKGSMSQLQVDGMDLILDIWSASEINTDVRHLAYELATAFHETAQKMQPIPETGKGKGKAYGVKDPETGQTYYGRGLVQLTWRENYAKADRIMGWLGDDRCEYNADLQLKIEYAAPTMFKGMEDGWFRASANGQRQTLDRYFNDKINNAYGAREIINGDKAVVPKWSNGVSIGKLIQDYHNKFETALNEATIKSPIPRPEPEKKVVTITVTAPDDVEVILVRA